MPHILALDLGTNTGWAMKTLAGNICSGVQSFKPGRFDGGGMRYLRFSKWLEEITAGVTYVCFEEVRRHVATDAAHVYGGLLAHLTAFCEAQGIPYEGVPVGTIKKHATGKGNADKAAMIEAARAQGYMPKDDNEADALALLDYSLKHRAFRPESLPPKPVKHKTPEQWAALDAVTKERL